MHRRRRLGPGPAGSDITSALTWLELGVARLIGECTDHGDVLQVRTPDNAGYYHGNFLLLPAPPRDEDELARATRRFRALFARDPVRHVCLCWDAAPLGDEVRSEALEQGFVVDVGVEMTLGVERLPEPQQDGRITVRALERQEWAQMEALNRAADPLEATSEEHRLFKERWRASWRRLVEQGHAAWFGAFWEGELVGQCGLASVEGPGGALGGFESVETHPDHRRKGVCSALMAAVVREQAHHHALGFVLSAEPLGPAIALYRRLGFTDAGRHESLVLRPH